LRRGVEDGDALVITAALVLYAEVMGMLKAFFLLSLVVGFCESGKYDRSITVFSPEGDLLQVKYAEKAVQKGLPVIALSNGEDSVVFCFERAQSQRLQLCRTSEKFIKIDEHAFMSFSGLMADGRALAKKIRIECQKYRFQLGEAPPIEYIAARVGDIQYSYTRKGGARPFGVSCLVAGFDHAGDGCPRLFRVDPFGAFGQWSAGVVGARSTQAEEALLANLYKMGEEKHQAHPPGSGGVLSRLRNLTVKELAELGLKSLSQVSEKEKVESDVQTYDVVSIHRSSFSEISLQRIENITLSSNSTHIQELEKI